MFITAPFGKVGPSCQERGIVPQSSSLLQRRRPRSAPPGPERGRAALSVSPHPQVNYLGTGPTDPHFQLAAKPPPVPRDPLGVVANANVMRTQAEAMTRMHNARENIEQARWRPHAQPRTIMRARHCLLLLPLLQHGTGRRPRVSSPLPAGPALPERLRDPSEHQGAVLPADEEHCLRRGHLPQAAVRVQDRAPGRHLVAALGRATWRNLPCGSVTENHTVLEQEGAKQGADVVHRLKEQPGGGSASGPSIMLEESCRICTLCMRTSVADSVQQRT